LEPPEKKLWAVLVAAFLAATSPLQAADIGDVVFLGEWGERTPLSSGYLGTTTTNAVDHTTGQVYTMENFRIQSWDADGNLLGFWNCTSCNDLAVQQVTHGVYVTSRLDRILQYTSQGVLVRQWGSTGSGPGQVDQPYGIAVDSTTGEVYVVDTGNDRIQVFDGVGTYLREITTAELSSGRGTPQSVAFDETARTLWVTNPRFDSLLKLDEFGTLLTEVGGTEGQDPGLFRWPRGVALDAAGRPHVADTDNERIQYFDTDGTYLGTFQGPHNRTWGPFHPRDIAINHTSGAKYVNASYAFRVDKFDAANGHLLSFGDRILDGLYFANPLGLATSPVTGDVYVMDTDNFLLKRITTGGAFLSSFGGSDRIDITEPGLFGSFATSAVSVDPDGNLWTGGLFIHYGDDPDLMFAQKFDPEGSPLLAFIRENMAGIHYDERVRNLAIEPTSRAVWSADSRLKKAQKFDEFGNLLLEIGGVGSPCGIAVHGGFVYIADSAGQQIHKHQTDGTFVKRWGAPGSADGEFAFRSMSGLATDGAGNVYAADSDNDRIQQFSADGTFLGKFGIPGTGPGEFLVPRDLAFSPDDSIMHVVDGKNAVLSFCMPGFALSHCEMQLDTDGDLLRDADDNCPFLQNPLQEDAGGLEFDVADGIGDPCQCGDATDDGNVDAADLLAMRELLGGISQPTSLEKCSVSGGADCDLLDVVVLQREFGGLDPGIRQACDAGIR